MVGRRSPVRRAWLQRSCWSSSCWPAGRGPCGQAVLAGRRGAGGDRRGQGRGQGLVRGGDGARTEIRGAGRLFLTHDADETLEHLVRRSDELARAGRRVEQPAEALLQARFSRLLKQDPQTLRTFDGARAGREAAGRRAGRDRPGPGAAGIPAKPRPWSGGSAPRA